MRPGRYGKAFNMIKFRTMKDSRNEKGELLPDSERLTPFGHFLRSSSLDELPELWNVLKGDMSLVGPRPLLMEYLPYTMLNKLNGITCAPALPVMPKLTGVMQSVGNKNSN